MMDNLSISPFLYEQQASTTTVNSSTVENLFDPSFLADVESMGYDVFFKEDILNTPTLSHPTIDQLPTYPTVATTSYTSLLNDEVSVSSIIDTSSSGEESQGASLEEEETVDEQVDNNDKSSSGDSWTILVKDSSVMKKDCSTRIMLKSRKYHSKLPRDEHIDPHLYSSVTYSMKHEAVGSFVENMPKHQVLIARVEIIDPNTGIPVLKNDRPILDGATDCTIARTSQGFIADMKIKFNSCSYHFNKSSFAFRVSYAFDNLDRPFLVKQSRAFLIFARKPTVTTGKTSGKRKRNSSEDESGSNKKKKTSEKPAEGLTLFTTQLNTLFGSLQNLSESDKESAFNMLAQKIKANVKNWPM